MVKPGKKKEKKVWNWVSPLGQNKNHIEDGHSVFSSCINFLWVKILFQNSRWKDNKEEGKILVSTNEEENISHIYLLVMW